MKRENEIDNIESDQEVQYPHKSVKLDPDLENNQNQNDDEAMEELISQQTQIRPKGSVADAGIIKYVEVYNFMCHKYLAFDLGPQLNFIIGHNGSGKSAILTAITLALGGRATSTSRGNSLKSFVKSGESQSQIILKLKNEGTESYKSNIYGKTIIVERTIKDTGNSLKIKSEPGKTISTTRQELTAICDHFMIQVDNPMNVLSQDSARQFLSASHAKEKYEFFLKGTQLTQLSDEYQLISENISNARDATIRKKDRLPGLEEAANRAHSRYKDATKARDQQHKLIQFKSELAWSIPSTLKKEIANEENNCEISRQRMVAINDALEEAQRRVDETLVEVQKYDNMISNENEDKEILINEHSKLQDEVKVNKDKIRDIKQQGRHINSAINECESNIKNLKIQLNDELQRSGIDISAKHAEIRSKMERIQNEIESHAQIEIESNNEENRIKNEIEINLQRISELKSEKDRCENNITQIQTELNQIRQSQTNKTVSFGSKMPEILKEIDKNTWIEKPLGPLGKYVKLVDNKWNRVLESVLGQTLNAFACFNYQDKKKLLGILKKYWTFSPVIQVGERSFDFSSGEPDEQFVTIDRALKFDNEEIRCIFVNQTRSESSILVQDRKDADQIMRSRPHNVSNCYVSVGLFQVGGGSGSSTITLQQYKGPPRLTADFTEAKNNAEQQLSESRDSYKEITKQIHQFNIDIENLKKEGIKHTEKKRQSSKDQRDCEYQMNRHREELNEESPINIQALESAIQEAKAEEDNLIKQYEAIAMKENEFGMANAPLIERSKQIKDEINNFDNVRINISKQLEQAHGVHQEAHHQFNHRQKQKTSESAKLEQLESNIQKLNDDLTSATEKAYEICPERVETIRTMPSIQRDINGIEKALHARQQSSGISIEAVTAEYHKALDALELAKQDINDMNTFIRELKKALDLRTQKWLQFRKHIAMRAKYQFMFHLSNRGYYGTINFNHTERRLDLMVQTDDQLATQGGRDKDPKSLSGGEKSFSTICLLLSLWEAIGCPIRCLDEFDVFMDAVNRKISMKMMIDTAKSSTGIQYVLITPQDMSSISLGKEVKVHRMKDPERANVE